MNNSQNQINKILFYPSIENSLKYNLINDIILEQNYVEKNILDLSEKAGDLFEQFIEKSNKDHASVIKTGFENIDNKINLFKLGEHILIASQPGLGKSQLIVNLVTRFAQIHKVEFFTHEFPKSNIINRFLACYSGIDRNKIKKNILTKTDYDKLTTSKSKFQKLKLSISNYNNHNLNSIIKNCIKGIKEKGIKIIIIEDIQSLLIQNKNSWDEMKEDIPIFMQELKSLARKYNVCVITTFQLSRDLIDSGYGLDNSLELDLKRCGANEKDADKVIYLRKAEKYDISDDKKEKSLNNTMVINTKINLDEKFSMNLSINDEFTKFTDYILNNYI
jgi:replicative DNA helicase